MARTYELVPRPVQRVETALRRIVTDFPVPESLPILQQLHDYEPIAMQGQPPKTTAYGTAGATAGLTGRAAC